MQTFVTVIHILTCVFLVLAVLIQSGKGAEISASFSGSSQTVFGTSGGANFVTRFTFGAAALFMVTSVVLTVMGTQSSKSLFEGEATPPITQPAAPAPTGATAGTGAAPQATAPTGK